MDTPSASSSLHLARGLAILTLFLSHVIQIHGNKTTELSVLGRTVSFLGEFLAAPALLLILGLSVVASSKSAPRLALQGIGLLALGYGLNFFRASLPTLVGVPYRRDPWESLWMVDLLQLAGLSLLLLPWLRRLAWPGMAALALLTSLLAPFLWGITASPSPADLLWGKAWNVFFPWFPWAAFVLAGMAIAKASPGPGRAALVGFGLLAIAAPMAFSLALFPASLPRMPSSFPPEKQLGAIGALLLWLEALRWWASRFRLDHRSWLFQHLRFWSRHATAAYVCSWLLIMWLIGVVGTQKLGPWGVALVMLVVARFTHRMLQASNYIKLIIFKYLAK